MSLAISLPRRGLSVQKNVIEGTVLGIVLTGLSYIVGMRFGWIQSVDALEAFAVFTSYLCTYLCVMERRINYLVGVITTAAYSVLFWKAGLVASSTVNAYLTFALAYGWFRWKSDAQTRPVTRIELKWIPVYIAATAVAYFGAVWLTGLLGGTMAPTDSIILIGTILAQFLLDNKKIATWAVWAVVDVVAIYVYFNTGLTLAGFQYVFFLMNTLYGWFIWKESMQTKVEERELVSA